jgi:HEAT repeat protein
VALGRICEVKLPKLAQCPEDTGDAKNSDAWRLAVIVLLTTGLHTEITTPIHRGLINEEKVQSAIELATHLGYLGETGATSVAKLLKDKDVVFRRKVVQVLGKMGSLAVPALTDTLKDPDWETRWWATRTLRALGPRAKAAVPALMELLKDQEHWVGGGEVAAALKWIGLDVKTDVPVLIDTLKHPEPSVRVEAANILANLGPSGSAATAALKESFKDENGFVRAHAALAVWQITAEANTIVPLLINLLDHNDRDVRHIAAYALGRIGRAAEPAIPALVKRFDDEYHVNVVAASKALGRIGPASIPAVVRFLNAQGKSPWARKQAVFSLWQMGSVAVPSLEKLVQDKDKEVRQTASEALKIIEEFKGTPPPMPGGRT